jgi:hypothetical protein
MGPAGSNIPLRGNSTKKIEGTGKYIVYDYSFGYNSKNYYYFTIFDTDVNTGPKIEKVYTKIFNNVYAGINLYSVNAESETPYILLEYYDETELVDTSIVRKNYKVDKLILTTDNTEDIVVTINSTNLYTAPSGYTDNSPRYTSNEDNGYYAQAVLVKETENTQTLKYVLVRADGSKIDIDFPSTFSLTNYSGINYSITNSFIILRLFGDTRISYIYKIDYTNNSLVFISNLDQVFPTGTNYSLSDVVILKQYNLYFCFTNNLVRKPIIFVIRDVPTYGRDCILKQKLLNSKLFRAIKKYRNRRANIQ